MGGSSGGRSLEHTPTWAVAIVCFVLVSISIVIEHILHLIGKWLKKRHKRALYEAMEKLKSELMLLGFISLLLTVGEGPISNICVSETTGATWLPCKKSAHDVEVKHQSTRLLAAAAASDKCADKGKVSFVSAEGIHQLHIFIFVLVVFHVFYCVLTLALGGLKMRKWKSWEMETKTIEYEFSHDPERFRFAKQTSFGRRHLRFWTKNPVLMWIVCFFRQFVRSVPKIDYLTLRHGFIMAHLTPQSQATFNFQKYINKSLEEDFKVVVEISPPIWFAAVLFLLFNTHGWFSYLWLPFIPLVIILVVGTKLQVIITQMGVRYEENGEVVRGLPVVEVGDHLFWFGRPRIILYLINFVLFQNAYQLAFLAWTLFQSGFKSCFANSEDKIIRFSVGLLVQILCSYVTLPLYALVTQMGTSMKLTVFNEKVAKAMRKWHHAAKKQVKHNNTSVPTTPSHPLLRHLSSDVDSLRCSPVRSNLKVESWVTVDRSDDVDATTHGHFGSDRDVDVPSFAEQVTGGCFEVEDGRHEIDVGSTEFSFDRN